MDRTEPKTYPERDLSVSISLESLKISQDFKRRKQGIAATVERIEYDPNRTAFIALLTYEDGEQSYIIAPQRLAVGDKVEAGPKADIKPGSALPIANIPVGTLIHNVELKPGKGGQLARSAGTYVQLVGRDRGHAILRLASGEVRLVRSECMASIGAVSCAKNVTGLFPSNYCNLNGSS